MPTRRAVLAGLMTGSTAVAGCAALDRPATTDFLEFRLPGVDAGLARRHTCQATDGGGRSMAIEITRVPPPTEALALVFEYPNSVGGTFTHWVAWNIPASVSRIPSAIEQAAEPAGLQGGVQGLNGIRTLGYVGACPPPTGESQPYWFTLYALRRQLEIPAGSDRDPVDEALESATLASRRLETWFSRRPPDGDS